jgi:hypothetical protein
MKRNKIELDRKFTIMFLVLLFTTIFLNQNALKFIAEVLGLIKPWQLLACTSPSNSW